MVEKRIISVAGGHVGLPFKEISGGSFSLRGENYHRHPDSFQWASYCQSSPQFVVDGFIGSLVIPMIKTKVALLVEPPHLRPENYETAIKYQDNFDYIFTYDRKTLAQIDPHKRRFYVLGGSSVAFHKWGMYEKTANVCMFYSGKNETEGHKLREEIVNKIGGRVDVFGKGVGSPIPFKFDILRHYRYCIVIESGQCEHYFTEKIIDPISVGTIPVYWGCPSIGNWFNEFGITPLEWVLDEGGFDYWLNVERYESLLKYREENLIRARNYAICEDWMYNTYPEIFTND